MEDIPETTTKVYTRKYCTKNGDIKTCKQTVKYTRKSGKRGRKKIEHSRDLIITVHNLRQDKYTFDEIIEQINSEFSVKLSRYSLREILKNPPNN